jgi:hypothetical protein
LIEEISEKEVQKGEFLLNEYLYIHYENFLQLFVYMFIFLTSHTSMSEEDEIHDFLQKYQIDDYQTYLENCNQRVNDQVFIDDIRTLFQKNIERKEFYMILYLFGRLKLLGDFIQLLEVDDSFGRARHPDFKGKRGYIITQDRILGTYCSTVPDIRYMCKSTVSGDGIYYFYRE